MLFAGNPVVIRSAIQAQFGITRVDRCGWCKSMCSKGRGDLQLPPRGAAGECVWLGCRVGLFGLFDTKNKVPRGNLS